MRDIWRVISGFLLLWILHAPSLLRAGNDASWGYEKYEFGVEDNVVDVGVQPLWFPISLVAELMKRDQILKETLAEVGFTVRFHDFQNGPDINTYMFRQLLDGGMAGDLPTLHACVAMDTHIVSYVHLGTAFVLAKKAVSLEELQGKRVALVFGSGAHHVLLHSMAQYGMEEKAIELVNMGLLEMAEAFAKDAVDGVVVWEPVASAIRQNTPLAKVVHRGDFSGYFYFSDTFAHKNPLVVQALLAAQIRAMNYFERKPQGFEQAIRWSLGNLAAKGAKIPLPSPKMMIDLARKGVEWIQPMVIPATDLNQDGGLYQKLLFLRGAALLPRDASWEKVRGCLEPGALEEFYARKDRHPLHRFEYLP